MTYGPYLLLTPSWLLKVEYEIKTHPATKMNKCLLEDGSGNALMEPVIPHMIGIMR
jgi:hypothetical protein